MAWRLASGAAAWPYLAGAAVVFLALGLAAPRTLGPVERAWMKFAVVLGTVVTYLVLVITFFVVFAPFGLMARLIGRRPLSLGFRPGTTSYWEAIEPDSPYTRAAKPY